MVAFAERLPGNTEVVPTQRWSADAALLDDWQILSPVLLPPPSLVGLVPDWLIAEFDIDQFRHGRTIAFTYASGRTVERPILLDGVY